MSHTLKTEDGTYFIFNSDLSGDVAIDGLNPDGLRGTLRVSGRALLEFVAHYVSTERISALEQATTEEILGIPKLPG